MIQSTPERFASNGSGGLSRAYRAVTLRGAWRLAALLFIVGSVSTIPGTFLLDKDFEPWMYSLTALAILSGLICLALPWWRIDERWLAVVPVLATVEIAVAIGLTHPVFTYLYFFVAIYVALVFPALRRQAPFLLLILAALLAPLIYGDDGVRREILWPLATAPGVIFISVVVGRLTSNLEASRDAYRRLSSEDGLTGVGNYRSLVERLREETARHHRRGREFALLTLDLDDFKTVNETQGHLVGDLVLAIVGSMIDLKVRTEDQVFRQGGDEFSVLAPETSREQADMLAQRIEYALNKITSGSVRMSATVGTAVFPHDGASPGELLDSADSALRSRKVRPMAPVGRPVAPPGQPVPQPAMRAWRY